MSKHFYFIDPNGIYESEDGTLRYGLLKGKAAYEKLKERKIRFMRYQEGEDEIFVELMNQEQKRYRQYERREQYIRDSREEHAPLILSLDNVIEMDGEEVVYHDVIASDYDLEEEVVKYEELEMLRKYLSALNKEERKLVEALYLSENPISAREYAKRKGISHTAVNKQMEKILKKLELFFEKRFPF